jgi:hypothetical protein
MSAGEWEGFIHEWVDSLRQKYSDVQLYGGKGDMGCDIVGFKTTIGPDSPWDNYQCKHYAKPLSISDVVKEVGKLFYYASQGQLALPEHYYFVAPQGPGTELLNCLRKGTLKQELLKRWNTECRTKISASKTIELSTVMPTINAFDFSRITALSQLQIIEGHRQTRYYTLRFGGGLPNRELPIPKPPATFQENESVYIKKLVDAYADDQRRPFASVDDLNQAAPPLAKHLHRSREQFFSAESLQKFSRDNVPPGTFEHLQDEVFDGVQEVYEDETHASGYQRVLKTVQQARILQITGNPLIGVMHSNDRAGICHQLANDDRMTWVRETTDGKPEDKLQ